MTTKIIKSLKFAAIMLLLAGMIGCGKDKENNTICDCNSKTNPVEMVNMEGVVNFNESIQKWYIAVYDEGTYDAVKLFLPCNIENSYKEANKKVLLSGIIFDLTTKITAPAGNDYACIEISSMSSLP
ncbi:MAG: hypothetical protein LBK94_01900 [Prevotellaceae bacterium]|jgi:hypothetical protein|nr:hypothetical protein [Prevotellaceae bacterium]